MQVRKTRMLETGWIRKIVGLPEPEDSMYDKKMDRIIAIILLIAIFVMLMG